MDNAHVYLAMWDCLGFETIIDVTEAEQQALWSALQGKEVTAAIPFNQMMLRARFNLQRDPEIYTFSADANLETLLQLSEDCPQALVDLIRSKGHRLFGDHSRKKVIV